MGRQRAIYFGRVHHVIFHHRQRPAQSFFGRLKNKLDRAGDLFAKRRQHLRHRQPNRGVTIVPAGVHHARGLRNVIGLIRFDDRQGVHIKAQQDGGTRLVAFEQPDDSGFADSGSHLES